MESKIIQQQLNNLADRQVAATVENASFGWATLTRYVPLVLLAEKIDSKFVQNGECYVFEIGLNCGDVFSVNMVKSIEITETGAIIRLK